MFRCGRLREKYPFDLHVGSYIPSKNRDFVKNGIKSVLYRRDASYLTFSLDPVDLVAVYCLSPKKIGPVPRPPAIFSKQFGSS